MNRKKIMLILQMEDVEKKYIIIYYERMRNNSCLSKKERMTKKVNVDDTRGG